MWVEAGTGWARDVQENSRLEWPDYTGGMPLSSVLWF